jgi:hypothetical protein
MRSRERIGHLQAIVVFRAFGELVVFNVGFFDHGDIGNHCVYRAEYQARW